MPTPLKVTILGCGGSTGVPMVGNLWGRCDPNNPKNKRTRASILVQCRDKNILIDTSPDLRQQVLRHYVKRLDAILYTHHHADHAHGLNDVMLFSRRQKELIPIYGTEKTITDLRTTFLYAFPESQEAKNHYLPFLQSNVIQPGTLEVAGLSFITFPQDHITTVTLGYRIGDIAYTTDAKNLTPEAFKALEGVKIWIVDCVRHRPHPTHSHLAQTLEWIKEVNPQRAILTHLSPWADYDEITAELPPGVEVGYDGLEINIPS